MVAMSMRVTFWGATETVTGSRFVVDTGTARVLVDCGLFQGPKRLREKNWEPFPVDPATTQIRVLNGTSRPGLAGATDTELKARGFVTIEVGNFRPTGVQGTARIRFGELGVAAAYTVAAHVADPVFVLDRRTDATVDIIIGEEWNALVAVEEVQLAPTEPLANPTGCIPLDQALAKAQPAPSPSPSPSAEAATEETAAG